MAFATAALTLVVLTFALALLVDRTRVATIERLQASAPRIKRWGGVILALVGAWTLLLGLFAEEFATLFPV